MRALTRTMGSASTESSRKCFCQRITVLLPHIQFIYILRLFDPLDGGIEMNLHNREFQKVYATSSEYSWSDGEQFMKFCEAAQIPSPVFPNGMIEKNGPSITVKPYSFNLSSTSHSMISHVRWGAVYEILRGSADSVRGTESRQIF